MVTILTTMKKNMFHEDPNFLPTHYLASDAIITGTLGREVFAYIVERKVQWMVKSIIDKYPCDDNKPEIPIGDFLI